MKSPKGELVNLKAKALRQIANSGQNDYRKFLLSECVLAYKPLSDVEQVEFTKQLEQPPYQEAQKMAVTFFEQGVEKGLSEGLSEGLQKGQRQTLKMCLEERFGNLTEREEEIVDTWPTDELQDLARQLFQMQALSELKPYEEMHVQ